MADEVEVVEVAEPVRRHRGRRAAKWALGVLGALVLLVVAAVALLNSSIGHRWVVDQIAKVAPASGLKISIGRIDGNLYGKARLHDVTLSDPQGAFRTEVLATQRELAEVSVPDDTDEPLQAADVGDDRHLRLADAEGGIG